MIDAPLPPGAATPIPAAASDAPRDDAALRRVARELEASFLAEMLRAAELHSVSESFGGGIGEEQFASFMIHAHADAFAEAGGIGLAEHIFESLKERQRVGS